jgi:hypothetical protein
VCLCFAVQLICAVVIVICVLAPIFIDSLTVFCVIVCLIFFSNSPQIHLLAKRRAQLKKTIQTAVQEAMLFLDATPDQATKLELIEVRVADATATTP